MFNSIGMVKTKPYAPPKGGVGANNVEINEESDAYLIGQHDTTEDEDIVMTEVSDNEIPDETERKVMLINPKEKLSLHLSSVLNLRGIPMLDLRGIQQVFTECSREPCKI